MKTYHFMTIASSCLWGGFAMGCYHLAQTADVPGGDAGTGAMAGTNSAGAGGAFGEPGLAGGVIDSPGGQVDGDVSGGVMSGDATNGDAMDGDAMDGDATNGDATDGDATDGDTSEPGADGGPAVPLGTCTSGDITPCGAFMAPTDVEIPLGPYGAVMEYNVGQGFENSVAIGDLGLDLTCTLVVDVVGEDPELSDELLETRGRCPGCPDIDFSLYTVYRPANMVTGERYPLITWGNGTCVPPEGYGGLLRYVASHGFVIVAPNSRWEGDASEMIRGLDFMFAANRDPESPYYRRIDTGRVGAMGHGQGAVGARTAASDPRIEAVILFNGDFERGAFEAKPYLAVSGDYDIGDQTITSFEAAIGEAPMAAFIFYHQVVGIGPYRGNLTLMLEPERVVEPTVSWWKYIFFDDAAARAAFVGKDCGLCNRNLEFTFGQHGLE